jgi:hypothetical protein
MKQRIIQEHGGCINSWRGVTATNPNSVHPCLYDFYAQDSGDGEELYLRCPVKILVNDTVDRTASRMASGNAGMPVTVYETSKGTDTELADSIFEQLGQVVIGSCLNPQPAFPTL